MAKHIAAHLQTLMLLTIRLASLYDNWGEDGPILMDDASVEASNGDLALSTELAQQPSANSVLDEKFVTTYASEEEAAEVEDAREDDTPVPDADVDFDDIPRRPKGPSWLGFPMAPYGGIHTA